MPDSNDQEPQNPDRTMVRPSGPQAPADGEKTIVRVDGVAVPSPPPESDATVIVPQSFAAPSSFRPDGGSVASARDGAGAAGQASGAGSRGAGVAGGAGPDREETAVATSLTGRSTTSTGTGTSSRSTGSSWSSGSWADAPGKHLSVGDVIKDRFELLELIGEGGMGRVFRARDERKKEAQDRNPYLAIKILNEDFKHHPESLKALQREARKAQDLAHPNIVTVFDFDRDGSNVFMTMEYMDGTSLKDLIKRNPKGLPPAQVLEIIYGMCQGLAYAHAKKIVHSDFKPGNIFVTTDNHVKIFDFGIARAAKTKATDGGKGEEKTLFDASTLGALTPAYASPEMFAGLDPDPRDDIYALACIAYELFGGRHPFEKERGDLARDKKLVAQRLTGLNRRQWRGMVHGLEFERDKRTPSALQFLQEISSKRSKVPLIAGATGGGLVILGLLFGNNIMQLYRGSQEKALSAKIVARIQTKDDGEIAAALQDFAKISKENQQVVVDTARDALLAYYEKRARAFFDPAIEKFDFQKALEVWVEAQTLFPDSKKLSDIIDQAVEQKNKMLNDLTQQFNEFLAKGKILPMRGEEDVFVVLGRIGLLDPKSPILTDRRLADAYVRDARAALDASDLDKAELLISKGLFVFVGEVELVNLKDKLAGVKRAESEQSEIARLSGQIEEKIAVLKTREGMEELRAPLGRLREIKPDSPVLTKAEQALLKVLDAELKPVIDTQSWQKAQEVVSGMREFLSESSLQSRFDKIEEARDDFERKIETLYGKIAALFDGKVTEAAINGALSLIGEMEKLAPDDARLPRAWARVAQAYLGLARAAREGFRWDEARNFIDAALKQKIDEEMRLSLLKERDEVALAEKLRSQELTAQKEQKDRMAVERLEQEKIRKEKERQDRLQALYQEFDQSLAKMAPRERDAGKVLAILDRIEVASPGDLFIGEGKQKIEGVFLKDGATLRESGSVEQALKTLAEGQRVFPNSTLIASAVKEYEQALQTDKARKQQEKADTVRKNLEKAIAAPLYTAAWENNLHTMLKEIGTLAGASDPWLAATKTKIAELYLGQAQEKRAAQRYTEAYAMLDKAERFDSGNATVKKERQTVTAEEKAFAEEAKQKAKLAELEGRKQTLLTQAQANEVEQAKATLAKVKAEVAADDPFLAKTAPQAIAGAYLRLAEKKAGQDDPQGAIDLAKLGLGFDDKSADLQKAMAKYTKALEEKKKKSPEPAVEVKPPPVEPPKVEPPPAKGQIAVKPEPEVKPPPKDTAKPPTPEPQHVVVPPPPKAGVGPVSDKQCTVSFAGYGKQARAVCYDMISDQEKGPALVVVPGGEGVAKPYAIGKFEISNKDYSLYAKAAGKPVPAGDPNLPAVNISFQDAQGYTKWLSDKTGNNYRIPNDAEWLYAAKAGDKEPVTDYNCFLQQGSLIIKGNDLVAVSSGGQNAWGLKNYIGNAQEWVGSAKVRGGAFKDSMSSCTTALVKDHSGQPDELTGFRVMRDVGN